MDIPLDEVIYFDAISSSSTGAAADADSTPTFAVYEEATDTDIGVGGNMTKRTSLTGNYRGSFTASAANGFELGKWYNVIGSATIGSVATKGVLMRFRIVAAENTAGYPVGDTARINNVSTSSVTTINANQGTTQPINFHGTGASAYVKVDLVEVSDSTTDVTNLHLVFNTDFATIYDTTNKAFNGSLKFINGTSIAGTGTRIADAFVVMFNVASPVLTTASVNQTGDSYAIVNSGTHGNAAIKGYVDDIGTAGAGLTAIPWNAAWDAEVQSEVQDAIEANHLDHFIAVADPGGVVANSSFLAKLVSKSATPAFTSFDNTTDSLEAIRDRGDVSWVTATGFSTLDAAGVRTAVGLASANLDTQLGDIPTAIENADALLTRDVSNVEGTAPEHSLCYVVLASSEFDASGPSSLIVYKTDGTTVFATKTQTKTPGDDPIRVIS